MRNDFISNDFTVITKYAYTRSMLDKFLTASGQRDWVELFFVDDVKSKRIYDSMLIRVP